MKQSAQERAFEQAQLLKKRLDRLKLLRRSDYQWTTKLSDLAILHIDRSAKIASAGKRKKTQTYAAFLIRADHIAELGDFTVEEPGGFYESFIAKLAEPVSLTDSKQLAESLSLLAYHLYRPKPAGTWINCSKMHHTPAVEEIRNVICKRYGAESKH